MLAHSSVVSRFALALLFLAAAGLARAQQPVDLDDDAPGDTPPPPAAKPRPGPPLPPNELSAQTLFEFLVSEIAAQRGSPALAAQTYAELAKRTRDPRVARRAVEMANLAQMRDLGLQSARLWHDADPTSLQALQTVIVLMVSMKRVDDAEPYIAKLMAAEGAAPENVFMQLGRLLGANADAAQNLRVARRLADRYPSLPHAHFAVAQAAAAARDEALALAEVRRASALRPDWEIAAVYEAQLLQRRSPGEAARRLAAFLEKFPDSRDVRLNYARALVLDKRLPEARAEFDRILEKHRNDTDAIYTVGVLALQLKEYGVAEANMKRLLELGYRDANAVRYTLGQIAEEQKDWPRAVDWYKAIQCGEHALPARLRTANAIARQGRLDEARAFLRAVSPQGEQERVQLVSAESQLLRDANQHRAAFDLLGEALSKSPDQPDLLYDQALTAEKIDRYDVLEANLKRVIQIKPDHAHAYNALGYSFADRNVRLPEAKKLIEKAIELAPNDLYIVDSLGWVLYRMGDLKGATTHLRRAWEGRPDGEIGAHLGEVLWVQGQQDEARRIWEEALKVGPDNETLLKTLKRFNVR